MSSVKPIVIYGDFMSPNPCKIRIILEELGLPIESDIVSLGDVKNQKFIDINPNGRVPAIHDPNTGITLWETGAITTYLIEEYDKDRKLCYDSAPEKYLIQQWIAFQVSGQGPYYGQAVWFNYIHPQKHVDVIERYEKEIERVRSVLDLHLSKKAAQGSQTESSEVWLVGDKCTVADLSWVMWEHIAEFVLSQKGTPLKGTGKYPHYDAWIERLLNRPTSRKAIGRRLEEMSKGGLSHAIRDDMKDLLEDGVNSELK